MSTGMQPAVSGLQAALATPLDRNDLGRLASMHSLAQALVEAATDAGPAGAPHARLGQELVRALERVILDEAADPTSCLELIPVVVGALANAEQAQTAALDELAARLAAAASGIPGTTSAAAAAPCEPAPPPAAQTPAPPITAARPAAANAAPEGGESYVSEPLVLDLKEREHLEGFLDEAVEHMDNIEAGLLALESNPGDTGQINELFRPFHTIKGIAGFLNLRDINRLTHEIETILDLGRKSELQITPATVDLIFAGVDMLKSQLASIRAYLAAPTGGPCPQPEVGELIQRLRRAARPDVADSGRCRLGELLVAEGAATPHEVAGALVEQALHPSPVPRLGEILVEHGVTSRGQLEQALGQQAAGKTVLDNSIRVDTRKLDILVDAVGELVIAQSMVCLAEAGLGNDQLHRNVTQVTKIVRDVQETAMAMRMIPIGQTFQKMRRLVRDVAKKAGKKVELVISGEETELDKNVIQQISDPLVHMVRNAVDHGIESPADRQKAGKAETGLVHLHAYHQGDSIVIEIRDDGRGLDRDRILQKAIEKGLVAPDDVLTEQQVFALVLQPGFSTAAVVTDISGRGVGMDVVKRNVEQLRGKIEIASQPGQGSTFTIRLPLTLAIIDGMLVRVGRERMIIPTILIEQSLRPEPRQITTVQGRGAMLQVRGELCPLIQLGPLFAYGPPIDPCQNLVVIVQCEGQKIALVLDELIGQQQVVIKTLGERFKKVDGVSGAAILGDGRVGLILEPTGLLRLHNLRGSELYTAPRAEWSAVEPPDRDRRDALADGVNMCGATCPAEPVGAPV